MITKQWRRSIWGIFIILSGISALSIFAIPRFAKMLEKSREGFAKGFIGTSKSAASIYYGDTNGLWPQTLECLVPKYLDSVPRDPVFGSKKVVSIYDGTGGWVYDKNKGNVSPNFPTTIRYENFSFE
jgi:hypothetical protein